VAVKARPRRGKTLETVSIRPHARNFKLDIEPLLLETRHGREECGVIFEWNQRRSDYDPIRRCVGWMRSRVEDLGVYAARLDRHALAWNADVFELGCDRRADGDEVRREAVYEPKRAQDALGKAAMERQKRRNSEETQGARRDRLAIVAVKVNDIGAAAVARDVRDCKAQEEARDRWSRQRAQARTAEHRPRRKSPIGFSSDAIDEPYCMTTKRLSARQLPDVHFASAG
jgi:hypothetical protein